MAVTGMDMAPVTALVMVGVKFQEVNLKDNDEEKK